MRHWADLSRPRVQKKGRPDNETLRISPRAYLTRISSVRGRGLRNLDAVVADQLIRDYLWWATGSELEPARFCLASDFCSARDLFPTGPGTPDNGGGKNNKNHRYTADATRRSEKNPNSRGIDAELGAAR